jgi:hypothetical protein
MLQLHDLPTNPLYPAEELPSSPTASRVTLKLKVAARKSARETKTPPPPRSPNNNKLKAGAHWSDEYKERMQADMDALTSR